MTVKYDKRPISLIWIFIYWVKSGTRFLFTSQEKGWLWQFDDSLSFFEFQSSRKITYKKETEKVEIEKYSISLPTTYLNRLWTFALETMRGMNGSTGASPENRGYAGIPGQVPPMGLGLGPGGAASNMGLHSSAAAAAAAGLGGPELKHHADFLSRLLAATPSYMSEMGNPPPGFFSDWLRSKHIWTLHTIYHNIRY